MPLLGPRQIGKTTLALTIGETWPSIYLDLDLRSEVDRAKLSEPELYLASHGDKLVILDEVHRLPNVLQILRGSIDHNRRSGRPTSIVRRPAPRLIFCSPLQAKSLEQ